HPLFFFFILRPRPPSSTLFPYTTLFRSPEQRWARRRTRGARGPHQGRRDQVRKVADQRHHSVVLGRLHFQRDRAERPRQPRQARSEEHTSELQSPCNLVCRLLLEKKNKK